MHEMRRKEPIVTETDNAAPALPAATAEGSLSGSRQALAPLRSLVGVIADKSRFTVLLVLVLLAGELCLPVHFKPSSLLGAASGNAQHHEIASSLEAERAKVAALNAEQSRVQAEIELAKAQAQEIVLAATSRLQQETKSLEGQVQAMTQAYAAVYERANIIARVNAQLVSNAATMRSEVARSQQSGRVAATNLLDLGAGIASLLGNEEASERMAQMRDTYAERSLAEIDAAIRRELPTLNIEQWNTGLPDPAQLMIATYGPRAQPQVQPPEPIVIAPRPNSPAGLYQP